MRTSANLVIQIAALVMFFAFRVIGPGYLFMVFVVSVVGPFIAGTATLLAGSVRGRERLARRAAVPFMVAAAALVVAGACVADETGSAREPLPIAILLTGEGARYQDALWTLDAVGWLAVAVYLAALVWTAVALRTEVPRWAQWATAVVAVAAVAVTVVVEVNRRAALPDASDVAAAKARAESLGREVRTALGGSTATGRWEPCIGWWGATFKVTGDTPLTPKQARELLLGVGWQHVRGPDGGWVADREGHQLIVSDKTFTVSLYGCLSVNEESIEALIAEPPRAIG
ncbi:hypothetical protein [Alloactinosynnema sp. L-07]|uniref:hypothetical protein n=1 Tax=Alloactinosynnema sp. L-07 TaxID=1653480 RepID=UPI00065EF15C|nr:hypothetical protein [Alloactinosynnema sp. L-07]CRK60116.1 hypothetical protein [Alloactinosynnema sp. L-07]